jgi:hypothetical protein
MLDMTCVFGRWVFQNLDQPGFKGYTLFNRRIYKNDISIHINRAISRGGKISYFSIMWLHVYDDAVFVDTDVYLQSQPVSFEQVRHVIESIAQPVNAYIDVSRVELSDVDIIGLVKIIWTLHEHTRGQNLLNKLYFIGASSFIRSIWYDIQCVMPTFVRKCVSFA